LNNNCSTRETVETELSVREHLNRLESTDKLCDITVVSSCYMSHLV